MKFIIVTKSVIFLVVGVVLVTVFSNPMVDALTSLTDKTNNHLHSSKHGQHIPIPGMYNGLLFLIVKKIPPSYAVFYISFIITPICSNASEIVSSLIFAAKRKKVTSSMTFSQV